MENSIKQISELWDSPIDFDFNDLLRLTYHCYNVNPTHPFISVLQSFCFKETQEGLSEKDQKSIRKLIELFILFSQRSS